MRRWLALVLVMAFGFPSVSPAFALSGPDESHLPMCCRRGGAHHCAGGMSVSAPAAGRDAVGAPMHCPYGQQVAPAASQPNVLVAPGSQGLFVGRTAEPAPVARVQVWRVVLRDGASGTRGPPVELI